MTLDEYRTKPDWEVYEDTLLRTGWTPYWDRSIEELFATGAIACPGCGRSPAYVGMHKGDLALAFVVCRVPCGRWGWFLAPRARP